MKTLAILQSNYIPWKGYFDILRQADEFIFFDNAKYTKNDWRNRNQIKTPQGLTWLTIPVAGKHAAVKQRIQDVHVKDSAWADAHLSLIRQHYTPAHCFADIFPFVEQLYAATRHHEHLSAINRHFIARIAEFLEFDTRLTSATDYFSLQELDSFNPTQRLVELCRTVGANRYISGPAARDYMDTELFREHGIEIVWMDYSHYPVYPQLHGEFCPNVSIIDTLMILGKDTKDHFAMERQNG